MLSVLRTSKDSRRRTACWLLFLMAVTLSIMRPVVGQTDRAAVPAAEKQRAIVKLLEETYSLDRLDSTTKKQQAIRKLLEVTRDESLSTDERYVVLSRLIKLSQEIGDFPAWRESVERLCATFVVDREKETTRYLKAYLETITSASGFKAQTGAEIIELIQQIARADQYTEAHELLVSAEEVAQRVKASSAVKQNLTKAKESVAERRTAWLSFQAATKKLAVTPDDSAAVLSVGRWQAIYQSDWKAAVATLARSQDAKWKAAALQEQKAPESAADQAAVGDAWWDLAQAEAGTSKTALMIHAGEWYERGTPGLTSAVQKQLVARRLSEIAPLRPLLAAPAEGSSKPASAPGAAQAAQAPGEWVDLLEWATGVEWNSRGQDWDSHLQAPPTKDGLTIKGQRFCRHPLPAIIDGDYELEVEFTRQAGNQSVCIFFPIGIHNMHLELGAYGGDASGLHWIKGKHGFEGNGTTVRPAHFANGQRHRVLIHVKRTSDQAAFSIDFDDTKDYMKWNGPYSELTNHSDGWWTLSTVQQPWVGGWEVVVQFHKIRARMLSGTIKRSVITDADRDADLKEGFVRLVGQPAVSPTVGWAEFTVNQVPTHAGGAEVERLWPLVTREPILCRDFYGAHAPSRLKCEIPSGAKGFSTIGYNDRSRTTIFQILIDGEKVFDSGVTELAIAKLDIPPKAKLLELVVDTAGNPDSDCSYWCYPRFHTFPRDKITDKLLDGKPGSLKFGLAAIDVGFGKLTHNRPLDPVLKAVPIQFTDLVPCHEFLFAHGGSTVTYRVPAGMNWFSAIGYNVRSQSCKFQVWADARKLYESGNAGIVNLQVKIPNGTKTLELKVDDLGDLRGDVAIWCYPRLYKK